MLQSIVGSELEKTLHNMRILDKNTIDSASVETDSVTTKNDYLSSVCDKHTKLSGLSISFGRIHIALKVYTKLHGEYGINCEHSHVVGWEHVELTFIHVLPRIAFFTHTYNTATELTLFARIKNAFSGSVLRSYL